MSNNNPFSFGTPASSGAPSGGLFGSNSPFGSNQAGSNTGGSLFGKVGGGASSGTSSPSLFGTSNAASGQTPLFGAKPNTGSGASTPSFSFGNQNQSQSQSQNTSAAPSSTPLFGSAQTPNKTAEASAPSQTQSTASGIFGSKPSGLFGSNTSTTPAQQKGGPSLFSTTPANPPPASTSSGSAPSLFGAQNTQKTVFGGTNTQQTSAAPPATQSPASNLFGQAASSGASKPLFGATPSTTPASGGTPFGAANANQTPAPDSKTPASEAGSKPLFGNAPAATSATTQASASPFKFPTAGGANTLFSAASSQPSTTVASTATPQKSMFSGLGGTSSTTPSSTPAAAPSLFSGVNKQAGTTSNNALAPTTTTTSGPTQPASGGVLFGANLAATSTPATTAKAATAAATTAPTATTTTAPATTVPADTTKAPATTTPNLGASTLGPVPPAQSRLKNKTMDEIITRWATDLTKYQKEFRQQAEKVADWDRMLVENGAKVQKLYGNTVDAERATQEVERQLASVEGQQEELNSWLDRYEREVDEMLSKQVGPGETLQGPDQERERTYKLAEKLSERLDEMGKDLGSMIEEVNSASSTLSKTNKADEPISQIVRILNSHLSQLQTIDQGTAELQAKVNAAQKAGQSLGSRLGGYGQNGHNMGLGGNAVDDFYRSYMGRR
ncbi:Nsp1-like C-terminal region-domain-containing protein [Talaromyces proteolyticus]|uniref:Nucleoporin NSP1 n=1 Tax=Talaromyces proteolyticus TaxID=1131652 RepID=A0AAD4KYR8_9EURO|nr:Nsp1-like C-terminal region-domain-containing protein [Talaromyces proteolyticus]KAH8700305.1 Nsp1-like C-terminal region-domain-containing protein [Talaromyces proteolyticus]